MDSKYVLPLLCCFTSILAQCPTGWNLVQELDACILISSQANSFVANEAACAAAGGHLISIHTPFQNAIISAYIQNAGLSTDLNIGLSRPNANSSWQWTDKSNFDYQRWAQNEPGSKLCAAFGPTGGQWKGVDCAATDGRICAISQQSACLPGWKYLNATSMCYYHGQNASYSEAEKICIWHGGHLASVHSDEENEFIRSMTYSPTCQYVIGNWIAGTTLLGGTFDQKQNRTSWWVDGSSADYTKFVCQNENSQNNAILLRAFPMNSCPQDEEKCGGGNWRIGRFAINDSQPYPDYVCKSTPFTRTQCPIGWTYFPLTNFCYFHSTASASFSDAEEYCNAFGGHIASIHSSEENDFVQDLVWNPTCAHTSSGFQLGEVLLGGVYSGMKKGINYWIDGSATDYMHASCDLYHSASSTIVMAAHPRTCGSCYEGQWFLPSSLPDSGRKYGEFICKAPTYSHQT